MRSQRYIAAVALAVSALAAAQDKVELNTITKVQVSGGTITVVGSKKPNFTTFTMTDPARLVIDISEAVFSGVPDEQQVGNGIVTGIKTASYGSDASAIARVLIGFDKDYETDIQSTDTSLVVKVLGAGAGGEAVAAVTPPAESPPAEDAEAAARAEQERQAAAERAAADKAAQEKAGADKAEQERLAREEAKAKAEAEAARKAEAEEAKRLAAEEKKAKAEEAAAERERLKQEAEEAKRLAAEEKKAKAAEAAAERERLKQEAEEAKRLTAEERKAKADEAAAERERKRQEAEEARRAAAEEKKAKAEEAAAERERLKQEAEEARRLAAEEKKAKAEEARQQRLAAADTSRQEEAPADTSSSSSLSVSGRRKTMTFVGYKQEPSVSRVYVRTNEPVRYSVSKDGDRQVVLELENTTIGLDNNTRFLDTSYFNGTVAMVTPRYGPTRTVRIEIKLKEDVPYDAKQQGNEVYLDFQNR